MDQDIYLIGVPKEEIVGRKLPLTKEVMALFFYYHNVEKSKVKQSALRCVEKAEDHWKKAQIPTCGTQNAIDKVLGLFNKCNSKRKGSPAQTKRENVFEEKLKQLFDTAHMNVFKLISDDKKTFLKAQRSSSHRGFFHEDSEESTVMKSWK